jgi:hypothetical protein
MDVSDSSYYIQENKGSRGTPKKIFKKKYFQFQFVQRQISRKKYLSVGTLPFDRKKKC